MKRFTNTFGSAAIAVLALAAAAVSCGKLDETVDSAQVKIVQELRNKNIYERGNIPEDPEPTTISGYFDIVGGAYRYIVNEQNRDDREDGRLINPGDSISFHFDARVYGSNFENSPTFYTNIASRRLQISGENADFDTGTVSWPVVPLRIKIGDDPQILKSLQTALISCMAGVRAPADGEGGDNGNPNGDRAWTVASDQVRIYLTPDIAFGDKAVYNVPGSSTLVFEVTDMEIIE